MLSFAYLNEADLGPLGTAADSWKALPAKYESLRDEFNRRVINHLQGHWEGDAADAAFATMQKARQQYTDAATEAGRIAKLLQDAHTEFAKYQKELHSLVDKASGDNFRISDKGAIEDVDSRWDSPTASASPGFATERREKLDALESSMKRTLELATAADEAASAALERDANGDSESFNTSVYTSLDAVEADQASKLMKKDGRLTADERTQLNQLLSANRNDPEFSCRFAVKTGADDMLSKYNELINPPAGTQLSKSELAELKALQKNLGTTMATATTSDDGDPKHPDPAITKFQNDLLDAGQHNFNANPTESSYGLNGYQLTSSLMSNGKWDTDFLQDYGGALITAEQNGANAGQNPDAYWSGSNTRSLGSTNIGALDPMAGFMDALGHNPEASTKFLTSESTTNGEKVDHLDYLLEDRHWPEGAGYTGDSKNPSGYDNLGHALESATTGHVYDSGPSAKTPAHTENQANLMVEIVQSVSGNSELAHDGMQDSLGRISAEYMPDIHHALSQHSGESSLEKLYPHGDSAAANFSDTDITRFLYTVGKDPDGYAAINYGQTQYTSELINYHFRNPEAYGTSTAETLQGISARGSEVEAIIGHARRETLIEEGAEKDQEFNDALKSGGDWGKAITGVGIGIGTAAIVNPVGGLVAGAIAGTVSGGLIDSIVDGAQRDTSGRIVYQGGTEMSQLMDSTQRLTQSAATIADGESPSGMTSDEREAAVRTGVQQGEGYANDQLKRAGYELK